MTALPARKLRSFATPDDAQLAAADPRASVWVNASAGSGKTTVLTRRVTRLLLDGVKPERLLCLTFTRAGAAEMTNRITALFSKWVSCSDDELGDELGRFQGRAPDKDQLTEARRLFARVLACPGGLRIRTIHSFCQEILSRFPVEAGLPPHFSLIEGQELDALKTETINELLREAARAPESQLAADLAKLVTEIGEAKFEETLQNAVKAYAGLSEPADVLIDRLRGQLNLAPGDTVDALKAEAMRAIPEQDMRELAKRLCDEGRSFEKFGKRIATALALPADNRFTAFNDYNDVFLTGELTPRKPLISADTRKTRPDLVAVVETEADRLRLTLERIESLEAVNLTAAMVRFGQTFAARFSARKAARAALDYDDLIRETEKLLTQPNVNAWVLYKLDRGIDHVLVDEAQDTSRAQWNIVRALTSEFFDRTPEEEDRPRTLFVVGDEKQSIFSFQNADPQGFITMRDYFADKLAQSGRELVEIGQHTSFRSARAVLQAVDAVFANPAARAGVSRDPVRHETPPSRTEELLGRVELWPLIENDKQTDEDGWIVPVTCEDSRDPQAELAARIASRIRGWLDARFVLPGKKDPVRPGDIMILLRRRGRFADLMVRALKSLAVPVTGIDRMRLIRELPVLDLLSVVRFVLLPEDDLNLAALLRSPLVGLDEDELMHLAMRRDGVSLWQRLTDRADSDARLGKVRAWLAERLGEADFSTPFAFVSRLLALPCPADAACGRRALWKRLGVEALDPIEELVNAAQDFGHSHAPSLQNFLRWLTDGDSEIKREFDNGKKPGEDEGLVRIMTVHASKGLEAPIVFLPDTASVPQTSSQPKFQSMRDGTPVFIARKPAISAPLIAVHQDAYRKQMEEYRRLFYVALTRAANRLYICGWSAAKNGGNATQSWYQLALAGLKPLHQDHAPTEASDDQPAICIFADHPISPLPPAAPAAGSKSALPPLPDWARQTAAHTNRAPRPTPPSAGLEDNTAAATPDAAFARGRIIHRLLQSLPDIAAARRADAIDRFLAHPRHKLDAAQRADIAGEVTQLLNDATFAALFGPDSRAEVALTGKLNGIESFRQVDRLCLRGGEVWVVDYKTNRPPPADVGGVPAAYRAQVGEYRTLLRGIYPDKTVRCFLLWTYAPRLMELTP